jgi:hypothetical protein
MGMIGRPAAAWANTSLVVVVTLAWLSASIASCPQVRVKSVFEAGVKIRAAVPSLRPMKASLADNREFQEDDLEPCGLPGVWLASPPSLTPSQITPPQSVYLSLLTLAQQPLRC